MSSSVLPIVSSKNFIVSGLILRSLIHFEFVCGVRYCSNLILLPVAVQFSQHCLLKRLSLPHSIFLPSLLKKKRVPIGAWVYLGAFCLVSLAYVPFYVWYWHTKNYVFLCQYHTVLMTVAL